MMGTIVPAPSGSHSRMLFHPQNLGITLWIEVRQSAKPCHFHPMPVF
jgi:hypothetical protein